MHIKQTKTVLSTNNIIIVYYATEAAHIIHEYRTYTVSQKRVPPPNHGYNFVNSWSICKILSLLQKALNLQQNRYLITHHTLSTLLHYFEKLKNQKFALCMHVKHVSSVTFYHLSNRYMSNVMKISVNINTMQDSNILLFVRSLFLTSLKLCSYAR